MPVLQELYDPLAVMLMIRINRENTLAMSRKRNPALDGYFDRLNLLLWPRLKVRPPGRPGAPVSPAKGWPCTGVGG